MPYVTYRLEWKQASRVLDGSAPELDEYTYATAGPVIALDEEDQEETAGRFEIVYADLNRAMLDGVDPGLVMDTYSETFAGIYSALIDNGEIKQSVADLIDVREPGSNLLVLDRIELTPTYRARGLGRRVIETLIARLSAGAAAIALKPFPLQFENAGAGVWERPEAVRLRAYYETLGFTTIPESHVMARAAPSL